MGARGTLKVPSHLRPVPAGGDDGTVAASIKREAPVKPASVADNDTLSALWDELVTPLDELGLISPADGPTVEMAIRHFVAARAASDELLSGPAQVWDEKNGRPMKSPAHGVMSAQSAAFLEYAKQLGMTFVSRARTPAAKGREDDEPNPFASTGS